MFPIDITRRERAADALVHVLGLVLGAVGAIVMLIAATRSPDPGQLVPIAVYVGGLLAMLGCSALYNVWHTCRFRDWLRRLDHAAIFVMIAGTYTPLTLRLPGAWGTGLVAVVWTAAAAGVALKLWQPHRVEPLSVGLYLALGWVGVIALEPLLASVATATLLLLLLGGAIYSGGVVFHLARGRRYQTALWHGCVVVAATTHWFAVLSMLQA